MANTIYSEIDKQVNKTANDNKMQKSHYKSTSIDS
jgi:hypothetical protein